MESKSLDLLDLAVKSKDLDSIYDGVVVNLSSG